MVAQPATTPPPTAHCPLPTALPPLSDRESHLLSAFLIYRYDMVTLAEREKLGPADLLDFARSPAVQSHLAALKTFADQAFALRSLESRAKAIDSLEEVAKTSDNPIEKRRAASAILRGLCPLGGLPLRGGSRSSSPSLREGVGGREYGPPLRANHLNQSPPDVHSPLSTIHSPDPQISPSPNPEPPRPRVRPSPNLSHRQAAETIGAALKDQTHDSFATLHAFTAPKATLGEGPAPAGQEAFIKVARTFAPQARHAEVVLHNLSADHKSANYVCSLSVSSGNPATLQYLLTFTRSPDPPNPNCWLLASLKRKINKPGSG